MDFEKVFSEMLNVIQTNILNGGEEAIGLIKTHFTRYKEKLERLSLYRINGDITEEEFQARLKVIELTIESDVLALEVISKATLQKTINAVINVFTSAINRTISI